MVLPVMVALPYAVALAWQGKPMRGIPRGLVAAAMCAVVLACVPEMRRPRLGAVDTLVEVLDALGQSGCRSIVVATDSAYVLNINLVALADFRLAQRGHGIMATTIAYDAMQKKSLASTLARINKADAVRFEQPISRESDWLISRCSVA